MSDLWHLAASFVSARVFSGRRTLRLSPLSSWLFPFFALFSFRPLLHSEPSHTKQYRTRTKDLLLTCYIYAPWKEPPRTWLDWQRKESASKTSGWFGADWTDSIKYLIADLSTKFLFPSFSSGRLILSHAPCLFNLIIKTVQSSVKLFDLSFLCLSRCQGKKSRSEKSGFRFTFVPLPTRIIIKKKAAEVTTCRGPASIIHEDNHRFAVTVINLNDQDEGGLRSPEKRNKNMKTARPPPKKKNK